MRCRWGSPTRGTSCSAGWAGSPAAGWARPERARCSQCLPTCGPGDALGWALCPRPRPLPLHSRPRSCCCCPPAQQTPPPADCTVIGQIWTSQCKPLPSHRLGRRGRPFPARQPLCYTLHSPDIDLISSSAVRLKCWTVGRRPMHFTRRTCAEDSAGGDGAFLPTLSSFSPFFTTFCR